MRLVDRLARLFHLLHLAMVVVAAVASVVVIWPPEPSCFLLRTIITIHLDPLYRLLTCGLLLHRCPAPRPRRRHPLAPCSFRCCHPLSFVVAATRLPLCLIDVATTLFYPFCDGTSLHTHTHTRGKTNACLRTTMLWCGRAASIA